MFERLDRSLAPIPKWLFALWGLSGPLLGWFLKELLQDRIIGGTNTWLDQNLGPVMSTITSSALWLIWMALFGTCLWFVWWLTKQDARSSRGFIKVDGELEKQTGVPLPGVVGTHPDDVADKLRATKEALTFIRGSPATAAKIVSGLTTKWIHVASKGKDVETFVSSLREARALIHACYQTTHMLRERLREYDHLSLSLASEPDKEDLTTLTDRFAIAMTSSRNVLLIEPHAKNWIEWTTQWRVWRNAAEDRLIELKRELSR
jgi:hypothetical protein